MIEFTAQDGSRLFLNPNAIWHIRTSGADQTAIYASSGNALFVKGSVDEIAIRLADGMRANHLRSNPPSLQVVKDDDETEQ